MIDIRQGKHFTTLVPNAAAGKLATALLSEVSIQGGELVAVESSAGAMRNQMCLWPKRPRAGS